jgi:hypothetical protein
MEKNLCELQSQLALKEAMLTSVKQMNLIKKQETQKAAIDLLKLHYKK